MDPSQPQTVAAAQPVRVTLTGAVQKGPFVLGSSVTVTPTAAPAPTLSANTKSSAAIAADSTGDASGQVFKTETSNDRGEFSVSLAYQGPASIEATGYYYNEATGNLSGAPITLRAVTDVGETDASTYVNLITHLTYQRVRALVAAGSSVAEAQAQAESDLQNELGFGTSTKPASALNLEGGDDADDAYLFAVSTVFAQAAYVDAQNSSCSNCVDAKLQELVNTAGAQLAVDGTLSADTKAMLESARATIDNSKVEAALAARLAKTGSTATVPSLDRVIPWSVPKAVTDCAAAMDQSVSEGCRMAVCGVNQRPLTTGDIQNQLSWQAEFSATVCGSDCWAAMRCSAVQCSTLLSNGIRVVDTRCASCSLATFGVSAVPKKAGELAQQTLDMAREGQCDTDLGLAK